MMCQDDNSIRFIVVCSIFVIGCVAVGCQSIPPKGAPTYNQIGWKELDSKDSQYHGPIPLRTKFPPPAESAPAGGNKVKEIVLAGGSEVHVEFLGAPHLNKAQKVRIDGRITLPLIGEISVVGKYPSELEAELKDSYSRELQLANLTVTVVQHTPVYVVGSVKRAGRVELDRPLTVLEAITLAGGFEESEAQPKKILIIRHAGNKRHAIFRNLEAILKGQEDRPFYLDPFDIVYVPRKRIVRFNQWVEQYINKIIPRPGGIAYSSEDGGEVIVGR